jgi:hypothetical protein
MVTHWWSRLVQKSPPEPAPLDLRHMPYQAEERQGGRWHSTLSKRLVRKPFTFHRERRSMEIKPLGQQLPFTSVAQGHNSIHLKCSLQLLLDLAALCVA